MIRVYTEPRPLSAFSHVPGGILPQRQEQKEKNAAVYVTARHPCRGYHHLPVYYGSVRPIIRSLLLPERRNSIRLTSRSEHAPAGRAKKVLQALPAAQSTFSYDSIFPAMYSRTFSFGMSNATASSPYRNFSALFRYLSSTLITFLPTAIRSCFLM